MIVGDDGESFRLIAAQFLSYGKGCGSSIEIDAHSLLDKGYGGAGDCSLASRALSKSLSKRGERGIEFTQGATIGACNTLLTFQRRQVAPRSRFRDTQFLAELTDG